MTNAAVSIVKACLRFLIRLVPMKKRAVTLVARLPAWMKGPGMIRLGLALSSEVEDNFRCLTNLGLFDTPQIELPVRRVPACYTFGTPLQYTDEYGTLRLCASLIDECRTYIDVGAYCGYHLFYLLSRRPRTKQWYFFEPDAEFFSMLDANLRRSGFDYIVGCCAAVSDREGDATFYVDRTDSSMSSLHDVFRSVHNLQETRVGLVTLDGFMNSRSFDGKILLKVDVECAEEEFLVGSSGALTRIDYLIIELTGEGRRKGLIDRLISQYGFSCYHINRFRLEQMTKDDGRHMDYANPTNCHEYNWLFCRLPPDVLQNKTRENGFQVVSP